LEVWVYTVDEPADWKRMVDLGVTGLITDKPAELRKWLQENGYE
ncbi:MAG: glycerophosphodiester phosphodiesterase, partial [Candidatus Omnitrophica bacterium]|nr:glycerophosphodiester phosphodiesterase [Candidatus Omnitrophota bacterium]